MEEAFIFLFYHLAQRFGTPLKIDLSLDGDSISIENPDTATVQKLLDAFMAKHQAAATNITPSSKLQVTATVSKKARPTVL